MTTEYSDGDYLYGADIDNLVESTVNNGVLTGLGVTENTPTPDLNVIAAAGSGFAGETYFLKASGTTVPITAAHGSLDRLDLIVVNSSGTISAVAGTPATTPNPPDLPDNSILLAIVEVDATVTQILDADIIARGLFVGKIQNEHITDGEITNVKIADDQITNAKINSSAAIAMSKLSLAITNSEVAAGAAIAWTKLSKAGSNLNEIVTRSHTVLSGIGSNTHAGIDSHIGNTSSPHGTTMSISTKLTTPKVDNSGNITLESVNEHVYIRATSSGKNIYLTPSGKIYLQDDVIIEGNIQHNSDFLLIKHSDGSSIWVEIETAASGVFGGIRPNNNTQGYCGDSSHNWAWLYACDQNLSMCSEYPEPPKNTFEVLSMVKEFLPRNAPKGKIRSENYPEALKPIDSDKNDGSKMKAGLNVGRTLDWFMYAFSDIKVEFDAKDEVIQALQAQLTAMETRLQAIENTS